MYKIRYAKSAMITPVGSLADLVVRILYRSWTSIVFIITDIMLPKIIDSM